MPIVSQATIDFVNSIAAEGERIDTPCGEGTMAWRCWGGGPPLVLLHGGYGSWMHWIRNIRPLARQFTVIAPDMPGLGNSATPPEPWSAAGWPDRRCRARHRPAAHRPSGAGKAAPRRVLVRRRDRRQRRGAARTKAASVHGCRLERARARTLADAAGRVPDGADEEEEFATHRYNLNQLMIHDPDRIDELALYLQKTNHARARMRSRRFSRSGALIEALPQIAARLDGIWASATRPPTRMSRSARACCATLAGGPLHCRSRRRHWVQFEAAEQFNPILAEYAAG